MEPDYLGRDSVDCTLIDYSKDSAAVPGSAAISPSFHNVALSARPGVGYENDTGWQVVFSAPFATLRGGEQQTFQVYVTPTPQIQSDEYHFDLVAEYAVATGYNETIVLPFVVQVNPYGLVVTTWITPPTAKAGQDKVVRYELEITNDGVYPDSYSIDITADPSMRISAPPDVYIPPKESRIIPISVLTPKGKLYELGLSTPLLVKITSTGVGDVPSTGIYTAAATLQVRGAYVPIYWLPLTLVGLVSASVVARASTEKMRIRSEERGAPRPVVITPRQEVLLAELKRKDRDAYKEKKQSLDVVYQERVADYRGHRRERLARDREEAKQARLEFVQQKKARKAKRIDDKRARIEAKRAAKVEAREIKKREKVLAKARKKLLKAQKKQAKVDAKAAAKQAKVDAKAAKKQAKVDAKAAQEAAKQAKAQAKADKAAAKAAKKQQGDPPQ